MRCEREPSNPHDGYAVVVKTPTEDELDEETKSKETRPASRGRRRQTARDCCGKVVGRVPRELARCISGGLRNGVITDALWSLYRQLHP